MKRELFSGGNAPLICGRNILQKTHDKDIRTHMLELSYKANAIEFAQVAEPQLIMSKKSTRCVTVRQIAAYICN